MGFMKNISILLSILLLALVFGGCTKKNYNYNYDDNYYRNGAYNNSRIYPPPPPNHDRKDWDKDRRDNNHYRDNKRDNRRSNDNRPPSPPPQQDIKPNCPKNTTFNGKHCILPKDQVKPGKKGTINPCPKGMYVSGGKCVK